MLIDADITLKEYIQRADKRTKQYKLFKVMYDDFSINRPQYLDISINDLVGGYTKKLMVLSN